jgi:hypothetical protein
MQSFLKVLILYRILLDLLPSVEFFQTQNQKSHYLLNNKTMNVWKSTLLKYLI